jgi:hypothetical protein
MNDKLPLEPRLCAKAYYSGNVMFEQQSSGYAVFSGKFALFHSLSSNIYLPDQ